MTEYGAHTTTHNKPTPLLSQDAAEKKAARKKLLDEIYRRRAENNKRFYAIMAEQAKKTPIESKQ